MSEMLDESLKPFPTLYYEIVHSRRFCEQEVGRQGVVLAVAEGGEEPCRQSPPSLQASAIMPGARRHATFSTVFFGSCLSEEGPSPLEIQ